MTPETFVAGQVPAERKDTARFRTIGFYSLLVTIILSPIVFWPSQYIVLDTIKTFIIGLGVVSSAIFLSIGALKDKSISMPPKRVMWTSILMVVSLIISALMSTHAGKSLFGQGFELNTVSFISVIFLAGLLAYSVASQRSDRVAKLYVGVVVSYLVIFIFQFMRLLFGPSFVSFSVFTSKTSSMISSWPDLGTLSLVIAIISISAIAMLTVSKRIKIIFWILAILSIFSAIAIFNPHAWFVMFALLIGLTILSTMRRVRSSTEKGIVSMVKNIAWLPLVACVVVGLFVWKTNTIINPVAQTLNTSYSEMRLPWPQTLDVAAGAIKQNPMFGVGTNHFSQSYLQYKPDEVNMSDAWAVEFSYGFGLIPTLIAEQGIVGLILWVLFFVFLGLIGVRVSKTPRERSFERYIAVSSFVVTVFLWVIAIISVPAQIILLLTLVMTGIFVGSSVSSGLENGVTLVPKTKKCELAFRIISIILIVLLAVWALIFIKKLIALSYFGSGVKALTVNNDSDSALASFQKADKFDHSDVYLQGQTEARLARANLIATEIGKAKDASSSDPLVKSFADTVNNALLDARAAMSYDPTDYYNRISEARVSELATNLKMQNAYDNAVVAYTNAINLNPKNPAIYLNLAKLQINQNKLADSLKTIGAALQVKPNYLDAVFLLSQVYAANGDLANAIIAAKFAVQLNPQNAQVYFQLGLLQYNNKDYAAAVTAFESAVKLQADYANAQYFLGLSYARVSKNSDAITVFQQLAKSNPDNAEVASILSNLIDGKSIFSSPQSVSAPEKRSTLPIKSKK